MESSPFPEVYTASSGGLKEASGSPYTSSFFNGPFPRFDFSFLQSPATAIMAGAILVVQDQKCLPDRSARCHHKEIYLLSSSAIRHSLVTVALPMALAAFPLNGQSIEQGDVVSRTGYVQSWSDAASESASGSASTSKTQSADENSGASQSTDFNQDIYYRNKLEFSLESGWLPINVPLVFDFLVGSPYTKWPLNYTMQPNVASLRWHVDGIEGPSVLRGNWDFTFSGSFTAIPRGPETRYIAFDYGIRRNFVPRRWRIAPYFEMRGGVGDINAKGPDRVLYAQGQDLTFTLMLGSGARYNFNPRYSVAAGLTYMHVSNAYLSQPRYEDFGINVYGPIVGINMRLGKQKRRSEE